MKLVRLLLYYALGIVGIIFISVVPTSMRENGMFRVIPYFETLFTFIKNLFNKEMWIFHYQSYNEFIFTFLWDPYLYSMKILMGAVIVGFTIAFALAIVTIFLPKPIVAFIKRVMNLLETVPDLMFAFMLQLLIVYIFERTGVLVMEFASYDEKIVALPMFILAILPTISFYRIVMMYFEEQQREQYVEFAKSKGLVYISIVFRHIIRNLAPNAFYHSKIIIWSSLSSLFVIEYVFNINGISAFIFERLNSMTIAVSLFMIFTPFFFLFQIGEALTIRTSEDSEVYFFRDKKPRFYVLRVVGGWFASIGRALYPYLKNPKFFVGFAFLVGFLFFSMYQSWFAEESMKHIVYMYDDEGRLSSAPPHPPSEHFLFGSDHWGYSIKDQIIVGAKYTLFFASVIAFARIALGFMLAIPYAFLVRGKWKRFIEKTVDSMHFVPITVLAYLLLQPILLSGPEGWEMILTERIFAQIFVLTILVVPLVMVLIGNEIKMLLQTEYMMSARTLGGDWKHMLKVHLMPHLAPRLGVVFGQQFIQVLLILIHLGLFKLFFGGTIISYGLMKDPPRTATYEWAGMISNAKNALMTQQYWFILPVFGAFIISIIAMQFMLEGMKEVQQHRIGVGIPASALKRRRWSFKRKKKVEQEQVPSVNSESFTFIHAGNKSQHL